MACANKKAHCPSISAIKDKYYELYRGQGAGSSSDHQRKDDELEAEVQQLESQE